MKRLYLTIAFIFLTIIMISQEEPTQSSTYLFINTEPINARVIIDGTDKGIVTPCLLRDITSYQNIELSYKGYKKLSIKVPNISVDELDVVLTPQAFDLYFPERYTYQISGVEFKGPLYISDLKDGNYDIKLIDNKIAFNKVSSFLPVEVSLGTALGMSAILMGTSIGMSEYYLYQSNTASSDFEKRHYSQVKDGMDIAKYVGISLTSVLALALSAVVISDVSMRYYNSQQNIKIEDKMPEDNGKNLFDTSLQFLSMGDIEKSLKILQSLSAVYPNSNYIPSVYYQMGQNYYLLHEYDDALKYFQTFISSYPLKAYYDTAIKNMAEIYYIQKDFDSALKILKKAVYTDNTVVNEALISLKAKLNFDLWQADKTEELFNACEHNLLLLINNFNNPDRIDFYYLQLINLYNMNNSSDKLMSLKEKVSQIQEPSLRELILSYF